MKKKIKLFSIFHVQGCYVVALFRVSGLFYNNMLQKPVKTTDVFIIQTYKTGSGLLPMEWKRLSLSELIYK